MIIASFGAAMFCGHGKSFAASALSFLMQMETLRVAAGIVIPPSVE